MGIAGVEPAVSYSPTAYKAAALTAELYPQIYNKKNTESSSGQPRTLFMYIGGNQMQNLR